jgi:hypothetical protein
MTIQISITYGFVHNWTLKAYGKSFYLGQDIKFCHRILGCEPSYIIKQIGSNDLSKETTKKKLAKFILDNLNITRKNINSIDPWQICGE